MSKKGKSEESGRITAVYMDGNTLMAAAVSLSDEGRVRIHGLRLVETEDLVERIERIPHPIFMNTEHMVFPEQEILSQALDVLLDSPEFRTPIVGVMPPDLVDQWTDETVCTARTQNKRVHAGIKAVLDGNPYGYPKLLSYDLVGEDLSTAKADKSRVHLWTCRFDDVLSLADQLLRLDHPFLGLVTAQRSLNEVVRDAVEARGGKPVILIDIGKLRTTYVGMSRTRRPFIHAIPVGLAREDNRYFTSFIPTLPSVREIAERAGGLLSTAEFTPSGHFEAYHHVTPQVELTRFASTVSQYTSRVLNDVWGSNGTGDPAHVVLSGLSAGVPGLRSFLESRTASVIEPFEDGAESLWECDDAALIPRIRNFLPAIGGAIAFLRREQSHCGIVVRERRPQRFSLSADKLPQMEPENVYVLEWGRPSGRR